MDTRERSISNDAAIANIGAEMGRRRITQKRLAQLLGMSQAAISDRQRGHTPWSLAELDRVAGLFGLPASDLVASNVRPFPSGLAGNDAADNITRGYDIGCVITQADLALTA